jgi:hypothetical protein
MKHPPATRLARWAFGDLLLVIAAVLATSIPTSHGQPQVRVGSFRPSTHGLHFANSFPSMPHISIPFPTGPINIGDASNGMCGGMVYAVRDYFEAGLPIPSQTTAPGSNSALYIYLTVRLYDSFDIPVGPARYYGLMSPLTFDFGEGGRGWIMVRTEWPLIRADLDAGILSPMGLIRTISVNPADMGTNHQVLAYGYSLQGSTVRIFVYDPNHPDDDNVSIEFSTANPLNATPVTYTSSAGLIEGERMNCFFRSFYRYVSPVGAVHVDQGSPCLFPDGAPNCGALPGGPFHTVASGANFANPGVLLMIRTGSYPERGTYSKTSTYRTWGGPVTIGR